MFDFKKLLLVVVLLLVAVLVGGCSKQDAPTSPSETQPGPGQPVDYTVYSINGSNINPQILSYKPLSGKLDSIPLAGEIPLRLGVSADGTKLYLSDHDRVGIMDAYTHEDLGEIPHIGWIGVVASPDGKLLALLSDTLRIVDATSHELIYKEKVRIVHGTFTSDSKQFVGADITTHEVYALDIDEYKSTRTMIGTSGVGRVVPSPDGLLWYAGLRNYQYDFVIYDPTTDSILLSDIWLGRNDIAVGADGRYVFCSFGHYDPRGIVDSPFVRVYDVASQTVHTDIYTLNIPYDNDTVSVTDRFVSGQKAITPDGRWLVIGGGAFFNSGPIAIDVETMTVARNPGRIGGQFAEPVCGLQ